MDECCCTPGCKGMKWLVGGIVLLLIAIFLPKWNPLIVLGVLMILKSIWVFAMPKCVCNKDSKPVKSKKK